MQLPRTTFKKLCFLVLLICFRSLQPADDASLRYTYTVNKSGSGPWRQEVKGQVNENTFIYCGSINNCHAIGLIGKKLNVTKTWDLQCDTLKDGLGQVTDQALLMKPENDTIREPLSLQVRISCSHGADGNSYASCDLYLNGQKVLYLHPSTGKWTKVDPGSMQIKEMWEKNKDLTDFLYRTSQGDCKAWLKEMIKSHLEEKLERTGLVKDTAGIFTSASPTIAPDVDQNSSMTMQPNAFVLLFALALLFLL
ncbi:UL16-binding protein 1-like [Microtus oregoni]|uniref:UL16-binding protein 1-like n=1 Tax=Microtus oregoni TaxID=111838 RepID=UPI001BB1B6BE|nr:UL16-binding protein 1-like [Microtus oregoni]